MKTMEMEVLEKVLAPLGEFGPYQLKQHMLHLVVGFLIAIQMLAVTFTAPKPEFRCFIPQLDQSNKTFEEADLFKYIPHDHSGNLDSCSKFKNVNETTPTNEIASCEGQYIYNHTYFQTSRVIEWNLVCDRRYLHAMLQSSFMLGMLFGVFIWGYLADRYGRKPVLCICGAIQVFFSLASALASNYYLFIVTHFLNAVLGSGGVLGTAFVLTMELVGPSKRTVCGILCNMMFGIGVMAMAFWAWLIPNVRQLQIVYTLHSCILLSYWWLADESIRWLWGKGRYQEALHIVAKAVKYNRQKCGNALPKDNCQVNDLPSEFDLYTFQNNIKEESNFKISKETDATLLLRLPNLRFRTFVMGLVWSANSFVYYGLSFGSLPGNPFIMSAINGLVDVPACLIVIALLDKVGRRSLQSLLLFVAGVACITFAFIPHNDVTVSLAMVAKMAVAGSFAISYNYSAEMFPTVIRNSAIGIFSMLARISGMLVPVVMMLDGISKVLPGTFFGTTALLAAFFVLYLPETRNMSVLQTIEDGENFGKGDIAFKSFFRNFEGFLDYRHHMKN